MRGIDTVARFGGDEFVAMMSGISQPDECEHAARHIIEAFSQPFTHNAVTATIGVSIGVAVAPLHGRDPSQLLDMADRALYEAKNQGRNRYKMYQPKIELAVNNVPVA